jgi:hypothetical protein
MRCIKSKPIFTSLLFILIFSSCGKEFLTENPRDRLVDESFFKTVKHIEQSIHPLYALASRISRDAMVIGVQLGADDLLTVDDLNKADFQEFDLFDRNGVNRRSQGIWSWSYFTIQQSNFILENVDRADAQLEVKTLQKRRLVSSGHILISG